MKRHGIFLLILALTLGLLSGCSQEKEPYVPTGGALAGEEQTTPTRPNVQETPAVSLVYYPSRTLNPMDAKDYTNRALFSLIYQGLFAVDGEYTVWPILCESYNVSPDMKTYTFHLADAYFSDGTPLTAADVAASLTASRESPWYGGRLQQVDTVTPYGDTVVLTLKTPMENLPMLLDIPILKAGELDASQPVGTGPFRLDISAQGKWLRRQAGWWCDGALPVDAEFITLVEAQSTPGIRDSFEFEGVSLVCADPGRADYVDFRGDHELFDCENGLFLYMVVNEKSELLSDPALRAALTHAIDRQSISQRYYRGFAQPASLPASPDSPWYNRSLSQRFAYDADKFAAAVAASDAEDKSVTMVLCSDDVMRRRVGNAVAAMLEAGGISVTIQEVSADRLDETLRWSSYDLYLGQTKLSANMDLSAFFASNGSLKYGGLSDPGIYAMCLEALANSGNYYNLHEMVMEEGQLIPILFQNYAVYAQRGVFTGLQPARDNLFFYHTGRTLADALVKE